MGITEKFDEAVAAAPAKSQTLGTWGSAAALSGICLGFFMILLDGSALNIALPSIRADTHGSMSAVQWLVNIYTIPLACLLLTAGMLGDRVGARRVFLMALGGFTAASLACAASPGLGLLIVFRCVQGVFAAGVLPTTLALIARTYPDPAERARAITIWGATGGIALVAGPIGGGVLTEALGWRSMFLINVPVGAVALSLSYRHIRETDRRKEESFDWPGQLLAIVGLGALVAGLIEAGQRGWASPLTAALLAAAVAAFTGFLMVEARSNAPVLPLRMFRRAAFTASVANGFAFQFGAYGLQFMLALYLQSHWGYDALTTGVFFVPFAVLWTGATLILNRLWAPRGMRWLLISGSLLAAAGGIVCVTVAGPGTWPMLLAGTALVGIGCGLFGPSCNGAAMASADPQYAGLASGVLNTSRQIGMAIGVALLGICLTLPDPVAGARIGITLITICFGGIALLSWRYIPSRQGLATS